MHASPLCLPESWNSLIGAWQPKQPEASNFAGLAAGAAFGAAAAFVAAGACCAEASGVTRTTMHRSRLQDAQDRRFLPHGSPDLARDESGGRYNGRLPPRLTAIKAVERPAVLPRWR